MAYEPRKRSYKIRWKFAVPMLFLLVLLIYVVVSFLLPNKEEEKKFTVCGLDEKKTVELLNKKFPDTFKVKDYTYYGESLGLYTDAYTPENKDELAGKTMKITNLCNGKTQTITNDADIDQKILLNELNPGFYTLKVVDNLIEKRLVYDKTIHSEPFYTIKRKDAIQSIEMIADKDLLKDYELQLDANYLFLNVEKKKPIKDQVDVFIDPYGMNTDFQYVPDKGNTGNGLSEYKEMYDAALLIQKQLESYGLRVEVSRTSQSGEAKKAYGEDGRFSQAYKAGAKYYLMLRFNKSETSSLNGLEVWHSSYSSSVLGKNIVYGLSTNLTMNISSYVNGDGSGVGASPIDKEVYDSNIYLRETGGKATFAASYSDLSKEENASFKDAFGMNAIEIDLGYVSNSEDAAFWKSNKEAIAKQCAQSFAQTLGVIDSK